MLTICTLVFTTLYQWGWVIRFFSVGQLSLAMGIFVVFAVMGFMSLTLGTRGGDDGALERSGLVAASMPLLFGIYLSAVPAYGASAGLLFGFMLLIDAALVAVAIGRGDELAHAIGATATLAVFAIWLAVSYVSGAWPTAVAFASASDPRRPLGVVASRRDRAALRCAARSRYQRRDEPAARSQGGHRSLRRSAVDLFRSAGWNSDGAVWAFNARRSPI